MNKQGGIQAKPSSYENYFMQNQLFWEGGKGQKNRVPQGMCCSGTEFPGSKIDQVQA
jgi:hypothetical protein